MVSSNLPPRSKHPIRDGLDRYERLDFGIKLHPAIATLMVVAPIAAGVAALWVFVFWLVDGLLH